MDMTLKIILQNVNFPYNFVFGKSSCLDQVNNPCHSYDNIGLRENELMVFFARLNSNKSFVRQLIWRHQFFNAIQIKPNPATSQLQIMETYKIDIISRSRSIRPFNAKWILNLGLDSNIDIEFLNPGFILRSNILQSEKRLFRFWKSDMSTGPVKRQYCCADSLIIEFQKSYFLYKIFIYRCNYTSWIYR